MTDRGHVHAALLARARPRAVAAFVRAFRDVDLAEDLYQEACLRALRTWPEKGVPDDPTGWLIRVGHNAGIDAARKKSRQSAQPAEDVMAGMQDGSGDEEAVAQRIDEAVYRDDVLRLMFMCCQPELSRADQLALALKVVVGFSVAEIARAFVVTPEAMERRITRAKKRAAEVATRLDTPSLAERAFRLKAVSTMVYLLFNEGYAAQSGEEHIRTALCDEAIRLARLLLELFPGQAEAMGLLALCLLQHSRHRARLDAAGDLVTLDRQDRALWDREAIAEGTVLVEKALGKKQPGPFQIQAAIAAVHCVARTADNTDWREIDALYAVLETVQPGPITTLNRAIATGKLRGAEAALEMLLPLGDSLGRYLPYHAARANLLTEAGRFAEARAAFMAVLECSPTDAERRHVERKLKELEKS